MRTMNSWLKEYLQSHKNPVNRRIHKICVPLITFATLGLLMTIPVPSGLERFQGLNWATLVAALCMLFYFRLNLKDAIFMLVEVVVFLALAEALLVRGALLPVAAAIFVVAWVVQIYGHRVEGANPSFLKNAAFLLIGPVWVNRELEAFLLGRRVVL